MNTTLKMYKLPEDGTKPVIVDIPMTHEGDIDLFGGREVHARHSSVRNLHILTDGEGMLSGRGYNKHTPHAMGDAYIARVNDEGKFVNVLDGDLNLFTN